MATTKSKKSAKKTTSKPKNVAEKAKETVEKKVEKKQANVFVQVFAKKYPEQEKISGLLRDPKTYAGILGEVLGVMILSFFALTLGFMQPLFFMFIYVVITMAVFGLSGANLNPLVTAGMMATRRYSVGKGLIYIFSQGLGAALGLLIINSFRLASETAAALPAMAEIASGKFWAVASIEIVGAILIGLFFARATVYKKSPLTFATITGIGTMLAVLFALLISGNYFSLQNNFALNPALAIIYQIFPTSGEFGTIMGNVAIALATYIIFPMIGGIIGFILADLGGKLAKENSNLV